MTWAWAAQHHSSYLSGEISGEWRCKPQERHGTYTEGLAATFSSSSFSFISLLLPDHSFLGPLRCCSCQYITLQIGSIQRASNLLQPLVQRNAADDVRFRFQQLVKALLRERNGRESWKTEDHHHHHHHHHHHQSIPTASAPAAAADEVQDCVLAQLDGLQAAAVCQ